MTDHSPYDRPALDPDAPQVPIAICTFQPSLESADGTRTVPCVAVAAGAAIYIYKKLRPCYRFALPCTAPTSQELTAWEAFVFAKGSATALQTVPIPCLTPPHQ